MSEHAFVIGWNAGMDCCKEEPGLILAFRQRRAREAAFSHPQEDRPEFIRGFLAGYAQSQVYKDMPPVSGGKQKEE